MTPRSDPPHPPPISSIPTLGAGAEREARLNPPRPPPGPSSCRTPGSRYPLHPTGWRLSTQHGSIPRFGSHEPRRPAAYGTEPGGPAVAPGDRSFPTHRARPPAAGVPRRERHGGSSRRREDIRRHVPGAAGCCSSSLARSSRSTARPAGPGPAGSLRAGPLGGRAPRYRGAGTDMGPSAPQQLGAARPTRARAEDGERAGCSLASRSLSRPRPDAVLWVPAGAQSAPTVPHRVMQQHRPGLVRGRHGPTWGFVCTQLRAPRPRGTPRRPHPARAPWYGSNPLSPP